MNGRVALAALCLLAFVVLLAVACGGGDDPSGGVTTRSAAPSDASVARQTSAGGDQLCNLLPESDVKSITGYDVKLVQPHSGPGFLHFCTIYLDVPGCHDQCALSLEDLGQVDPNGYNNPQSFRETFVTVNPETQPAFQDDVLGPGSWLAVATAGEVPGLFKLLYFQVGDVAFDLTSPRFQEGVLSAEQMIGLGRVVSGNTP